VSITTSRKSAPAETLPGFCSSQVSCSSKALVKTSLLPWPKRSLQAEQIVFTVVDIYWEWAPRATVVMFLISQNSEHTWWQECSLGFYGKNPNGQLLSLHHHCAVQKQPMPQKEMESDCRAMFFLVCICWCLPPPTLCLSVLGLGFAILVKKMRDSDWRQWRFQNSYEVKSY